MKKIIFALIATLTLTTTAYAWQSTNYYSYGNSISWNSYGSGGSSSGVCNSYGSTVMCNSW